MLEKATKEDIVAYTIRNVDNKLSTETNTKFKMSKKIIGKSILILCSFQMDILVNIISVRLNSLTVSMSNLDYSIRIHGLEKIHNRCFTCSGRKKCENYLQVFTMCSNVIKVDLWSVSSLLNRVDNSDEGLEATLCTMHQLYSIPGGSPQ